tara:strand:- start:2313 stop:2432 length:120 start_codon:yes stop_codon:yes gene_type:complete
MDKSNLDSTMNVLVWGVVLLGGIALFVVWGLSNAYSVIS